MTTMEKEIMIPVCSMFGVCYDLLWLTNREEYVDARAVICTLMGERGMTDSEIAGRFGKTRQCINKLRNSFRWRLRKWSVRNIYNKVTENGRNQKSN